MKNKVLTNSSPIEQVWSPDKTRSRHVRKTHITYYPAEKHPNSRNCSRATINNKECRDSITFAWNSRKKGTPYYNSKWFAKFSITYFTTHNFCHPITWILTKCLFLPSLEPIVLLNLVPSGSKYAREMAHNLLDQFPFDARPWNGTVQVKQ